MMQIPSADHKQNRWCWIVYFIHSTLGQSTAETVCLPCSMNYSIFNVLFIWSIFCFFKCHFAARRHNLHNKNLDGKMISLAKHTRWLWRHFTSLWRFLVQYFTKSLLLFSSLAVTAPLRALCIPNAQPHPKAPHPGRLHRFVCIR